MIEPAKRLARTTPPHTRRHVWLAIPLGALAALFGCDRPANEIDVSTTVDTVSGTVTITNHRGAGPLELDWRIREDYRVGGSDGLLLTNPLTGVTRGPTGQVFVLDMPAQEVIRLDGDGSDPTVMARAGPGPGELRFAGGMGWDPQDRLWVADGTGFYAVFDSVGGFIETVDRPIHGLVRRQFPLVFDEQGAFVDEALGSGVVFLRVAQAGTVADTLVSVPVKPADLPHVVLRPGQHELRFVLGHYVPEYRWAVTQDGTVWVARNDSLRLFEIELETGDTLRIVESDDRSDVELSRAEWNRIESSLSGAGLDPDEFEFVRPILESLLITDDGHILVQIVDTVGEDGQTFDVFDPDGLYLGSLLMPFAPSRYARHSIVGDTLLAITVGPNDEPQLVRATITRTPGAD